MKAGTAFALAASQPSAREVRFVFSESIRIAASCRVALREQARIFQRLFLACVVECGGAPPLSVAAEETQNVVRLGSSSPKILFRHLDWLPSALPKRRGSAALQNLAVISRSLFASNASKRLRLGSAE